MTLPIAKKAMTPRTTASTSSPKRVRVNTPALAKLPPKQIFRVEGIGRKGTIRFVKVTGFAGAWQITGLNGLKVQVAGNTVDDALRLAKRKIPFRPFAIRALTGTDSQ